jgi:predicted dehydrogenase
LLILTIIYIYQNFSQMRKYKWGILAPGKMSAKFTTGIRLLENAELWAVESRNPDRAKHFAEEFGFRKYYGSYEELAADPDLEVVYIASPHSYHCEHTLLCLRHGKHVICEKAFSLNLKEVKQMINEARERNLFLMEALWPPFQPFYKKGSEILDSGILGKIIHLHGYFTFNPPFDPGDRKFNLSLGGGSLLDIGIYPVIDALTFLGIPDEIKASASFGPTGSEESISIIFRYNTGPMATLYSSFRTSDGIGCRIMCEKGNMTVARGRDMNQCVVLDLHGREREEFTYAPPAMGYQWEAEEVMKCLDEGRTESRVVPHSFSLSLMETLDRIRKEACIVYTGRD